MSEQSMIGKSIGFDVIVKTWKEPREEVVLNSKWNNKKVLLKVFRRFGCPLCRLEAKILSNYKEEFEKLNVEVIGIGFDELGLKEWSENDFWSYDLYMDTERNFHKKMDFKRHGIWTGITSIFGEVEKSASKVCKERGIEGNMLVGDGFQLGGTYLIDAGGKILFEFKQNGYGDYPSLKEIIFAAGGDPNIVKHEDEKVVRKCNDQECRL